MLQLHSFNFWLVSFSGCHSIASGVLSWHDTEGLYLGSTATADFFRSAWMELLLWALCLHILSFSLSLTHLLSPISKPLSNNKKICNANTSKLSMRVPNPNLSLFVKQEDLNRFSHKTMASLQEEQNTAQFSQQNIPVKKQNKQKTMLGFGSSLQPL